MTDSPPPSSQPPQPPNQPTDPFVVNPIKMARARHASAHTPSAVVKVRDQTAKNPAQPATTNVWLSQLEVLKVGGLNGCLLLILLGVTFVAGGFVGGLMGGSLILWANSPQGAAILAGTPTPTQAPTPTPMPVATPTPILTPTPVATLSTEDVIGQIIPSVVTVINQQHVQALGLSPTEGRVVGSGVIVDVRGFIATNHHVIENPGTLSVILFNGQTVTAQLITSDPGQDLALLKVAATDLPVIQWGDSGMVRPGQAVYAIGSPLGDFPSSVSFGIISGLSRALEINQHVIGGLIQTDAAINRGSSGGPLVNSKGEVIGINTFIIRESEDRGVAEGIAFAIPAATAQNLLNAWIAAAGGQAVPIPASGAQGN